MNKNSNETHPVDKIESPERKIFYVDVGNLPDEKAEQYLHGMMTTHKNRVKYYPLSGKV